MKKENIENIENQEENNIEKDIEKKEEIKKEKEEDKKDDITQEKKEENNEEDDIDVISDKQEEIKTDNINKDNEDVEKKEEKKEEENKEEEKKEENKEEEKKEEEINEEKKEGEENNIQINEDIKETKEPVSEIISEKNETPRGPEKNEEVQNQEIKEQKEEENDKKEEKQEKEINEEKEDNEEKEKTQIKEKIEAKDETQIPKHNYKIDYYRENIFNLLNQLSEDIPLDIVPDFLKRAFAMDEVVFSQEFYFKGIFPKIIISKSTKDENKITGMCSFYYESNENLNDNLIIRIHSILVGKDHEEQIIEMINFIKNEVDCDKIMIYILYDKVDDKFIANTEAKEIFQNKLKFKWFCVVRDEKMDRRYIQYCFSKKEEIYDYNDEMHETTKAVNAIRFNKNNFMMNNLLITTINSQENNNIIKEQISHNKINYTKFININSLYYLLLQCKNIRINFNNKSDENDLTLMSEKIMRYSIYENNLKDIRDISATGLQKSIKRIETEIDDSIYKEIKDILQQKNINMEFIPNFFKTNLSLNFETNFSIVEDNVFYNRISSDKIQILEEEKTGSKFFLVPSKDNNILFYISEINNKLKNYLIDSKENIYEKFLEFQPSTQKKIYEFSFKSIRDVSYLPISPVNSVKTIYIPCFSFKTHLFAYDYKEINKTMKIMDKENEAQLNISTLDEFINIEFKPDNNIENSFTTIESNDLIIKDSFIIGIFDNNIINNTKLPLLQFLYITKNNFLTKSNYEL